MTDRIRTGDFFVCTAKPKNGLFSWLTRRIAMSDFVHAGVFFWEDGQLMCAEARIKGPHSSTTGFVIEQYKTRQNSLTDQYRATYLVRTPSKVTLQENEVIKTLGDMQGLGYSWLKGIPIALNISFGGKGIVCSTVCQRVYEACGLPVVEDWHPSGVFNVGVGIDKIL